jgi:hypothetical protein
MNMTQVTTLSTARALLLLGLSLGLSACGAARDPVGGTEQPIEGGDPAACLDGTPAGPGGPTCQVTAEGLCFVDAETACACAGCELESCLLAESFPAQAFCQSDEPVGDNPDEPVSDGNGASDGHGTQPGNDGSGCGTSGSPPAECSAGQPRDASGEGRCDFLVEGLCFDSEAAACACAGCEAASCVFLESYPVQVDCQ